MTCANGLGLTIAKLAFLFLQGRGHLILINEIQGEKTMVEIQGEQTMVTAYRPERM